MTTQFRHPNEGQELSRHHLTSKSNFRMQSNTISLYGNIGDRSGSWAFLRLHAKTIILSMNCTNESNTIYAYVTLKKIFEPPVASVSNCGAIAWCGEVSVRPGQPRPESSTRVRISVLPPTVKITQSYKVFLSFEACSNFQ